MATATIADPTLQGAQMDRLVEQSHSNNSASPVPKDFGLIPVPRHLRYDPTKPFHFGLLLNIAFGFSGTFSE